MSTIIRRAGADDCEALNRIVHGSSAYTGAYASILRDYAIRPEQTLRDEIHLAEDADRMVLGFYSLVLGATPELDLLFVSDAAQGRGLGRMLVGHLLRLAADLGVTHIKIVSHPPAAAFYRRMGAIEVGVAYPSGAATWPRPIFSLPVSR